jgi:hypothetical protein
VYISGTQIISEVCKYIREYMKTFREFIGESELDDLRRELGSLGFLRHEVQLEVYAIVEEGRYFHNCQGWCKGAGDTKEEALKHALWALGKAFPKGEISLQGNSLAAAKLDIPSRVLDDLMKGLPLHLAKNKIYPSVIDGTITADFREVEYPESFGNALVESKGKYYKPK